MRQIAYGHSGRSGGAGNKYKCPNSPHPKCPKCKRAMHRNFDFSGSTIRYRDGLWHCRNCEQAEASAALDFPFSKPNETRGMSDGQKEKLESL